MPVYCGKIVPSHSPAEKVNESELTVEMVLRSKLSARNWVRNILLVLRCRDAFVSVNLLASVERVKLG